MSEPTIVVLHGANGSAREVELLAAPLRAHGRVLVPDLPGHGGRELPDRLSIQGSARDVLALLDREKVERAVIVGYSLGGYVGLYLAARHPGRIQAVCAVATKFVFDPETIKYWTYLAQPERLERPGNPRAGELLASHGPHWKSVAIANATFFGDLGRESPLAEADFRAIERPVLLVSSNRDAVVKWEETLAMGKVIPGARLVMFYGLAHPLRNVPVTRVCEAIGQWIHEVAPA
jgi:pimeloyl-ACP methyl ester carboxylesterase